MPKIIDIRHPDYNASYDVWEKWRLTYRSGSEFIERYLSKYSIREDDTIFTSRKALTYVPAFAKSAINDVKNAIYQRTGDIVRLGGSSSYRDCILGRLNGVDLLGSSMSFFIGQYILPELLTMSRVGVYIDMPILDGPSKLDKGNKHPYIYLYAIEDILSWSYDQSDSPNEFSSVLLRDHNFIYDPETNLPINKSTSYRHLSLIDEGVKVQYYDLNGVSTSSTVLNIPKIPFVMRDIGDSLLSDVANYQIALMNLESSDIGYILSANYPFYTEQYDPRPASEYLESGNEADITVGPTQGRLYPTNTERPAFIHPSSEPLQISIQKQENIKRDIKILVNLAVSNLSPKMASAESKEVDNQGLEAGLSYLGLVLENLEMKISEYWAMYEASSPATIIYPTEYQLPNPATIREEINQDLVLLETINSKTYRKELVKRIVRRSIGTKISAITLRDIDVEIETATIVAADSRTMSTDLEAGLVSLKTASLARGYPEGDVEQAKIDQAERLKRIQEAQTPANPASGAARGIPDLSVDPALEARLEKNGKAGRGPAE